jgi:cytochrome P450
LFYTLLLIGQHEEVQRRLHDEIDSWNRRDSGSEIEGQNSREHEMIFKTDTFLDAVIKESLRLFPPVSRIARQVNQELVIRGSVSGLHYVLPGGTTVTIDIFQIHRDPTVFTNPDTFDPDRFYRQSDTSDRKVFMPFSLGPRSCIGSKFAIMELKIFLIKVLRKFTIVSRTPINQLKLAVEIVLKPCNENIQILFTRRMREK